MSNKVIIHCKPIVERQCYENEFNWSFSDVYGREEIDIIVDDIPYEVIDGKYQDPDEQLCEFYGIDYEKVNMIEAL